MAWYRAGTATFTNGSRNVTGAGTAWATNVRAGDEIIGPDNISREVETVTSDTTLTMVETYTGSTTAGAAYKVKPIQGWNRDVAAQLAALINDYGSIEAALTVLSGNVGIGTAFPSAKLHVSGGVFIGGPASLPNDAAPGSLFSFDAPVIREFIGDGTGYSRRWSSRAVGVTSDRMTVTDAGNVGVGTIAPATRLEVSGATTALRVSGTGGTPATLQLSSGGVAQWNLAANQSGAAEFSVSYSSMPILKIKPSGQIRLVPLTTDPVGEAGDMYFNGTTSKFRGHTGIGWVDLH